MVQLAIENLEGGVKEVVRDWCRVELLPPKERVDSQQKKSLKLVSFLFLDELLLSTSFLSIPRPAHSRAPVRISHLIDCFFVTWVFA